MPLETASFISQLNPSWPLLSDTVYSLQGHEVLLKQVLQSQFPNLGVVAVTGTAAALNTASGAFNGSVFTVPQVGSANASITLPAASGISVALTGGTGLNVVSQGPTVAAVTPAPVTELRTDGSGNFYALTSLNAPRVATTTVASASIQKNGYELVPSGVIMMWAGSAAAIPGGYALCNGANGTPNLVDKFLVGAGNLYNVGATGGTSSVSLALGNLPSHNHSITDPGHVHTIIDGGHTHSISDPGHGHSISDPGHLHSTQVTRTSTSAGSGLGATNYASGGDNTVYDNTQAENTTSVTTGISIIGHTTGVTANSAATGLANASAQTSITVGNTGSGTSFSILPPFYALCFIMKL